jgi:transposase-like protein
MVVFEMCASKNGVAAREVERKYDLTPKTAWFMLHRIREAMKREPLAGLLTGRIVADETFVGGKERNRHGRGARTVYERRSRQDKTAVLSLVSRETGEVRSRVLPNVHAATLRKVIREEVDMKASHLHSDSSFSYGAIGKLFVSHSSVDHSANEYVRGDVSTNQAENYFAQLKRSIDGTHHRVSRQHLPRYVAEFDFRFSTRKERDTARTRRFFRQVTGRRLTYRSPVSKTAF